MFGAAELEWKKQPCQIFLNDNNKKYADDFARKNKLKIKNLIGIHMGAGPRWPSKAWSPEKVMEFIVKAKQKGYEIILFGGPDEQEKLEPIAKALEKQNITICRNNPKNTKKEFASLVNLCRAVVCSDSLALHVSLALGKPTIGLFFCTSPDEVEGYGLLKKIISPMLRNFFPEKMDKYDEKLVNSISADEVLNAVNSVK